MRDDEFYKIFHSKGKSHFEQLYFVNKKKFTKGCGSYLFDGKKYNYDKSFYEKQKLLFELCKTNNKVLEIGSYMGHSILIMLLANPKIHVTAIDINDHYAKPSLKYLQKKFPKSKINFINNDSIEALGSLKENFDLFHLDGAHEHEVISKEFLFCINLRKSNNLKILFEVCSNLTFTINAPFLHEQRRKLCNTEMLEDLQWGRPSNIHNVSKGPLYFLTSSLLVAS